MKNIFMLIFAFLPAVMSAQWLNSVSGTSQNLKGLSFINSSTGYCVGENGTIIRTTNAGSSWEALPSGTSVNINAVFFINAATGIVCGDGGLIMRTTNNGLNWTGTVSGVTDDLKALSFVNDKGVCTGASGTLLYTTDAGSNWSVAKNGFLSIFYGANMFSETIAYAGGVNTIFQPLFGKTTNGGANWDFSTFYLNGNEGGITDVNFTSANEGFASAYVFDGQGAISHTINGGSNWTTQIFPFALRSIEFTGMNTGYSVGDNSIIVKTTNKGITWTEQQTPLSANLSCVEFTDSLNGFAAGENGTIFKTNNGGMTSVNDPSLSVSDFMLHQNYPNPFNPSTTINFEMKKSGRVSLIVYDIQGKIVRTLYDDLAEAGSHSVKFNAKDLAAGTYLYTFMSGSISETKKLVILK